jgi:hypothetical protein
MLLGKKPDATTLAKVLAVLEELPLVEETHYKTVYRLRLNQYRGRDSGLTAMYHTRWGLRCTIRDGGVPSCIYGLIADLISSRAGTSRRAKMPTAALLCAPSCISSSFI